MKTFAFIFAFVMSWAVQSFANTPQGENKMVAVVLIMDNGDEDKKVVTTIFTTLMAAEKVAQLMDIEVKASEDVTEGMLFFALKSEEQRQMTLKLFSEEGYQEAAHRELEIYEGNTYRALNVENLEDGSYIFQITDNEGNEHKQKVTINRSGITM